jgi:hypothetical protein
VSRRYSRGKKVTKPTRSVALRKRDTGIYSKMRCAAMFVTADQLAYAAGTARLWRAARPARAKAMASKFYLTSPAGLAAYLLLLRMRCYGASEAYKYAKFFFLRLLHVTWNHQAVTLAAFRPLQ